MRRTSSSNPQEPPFHPFSLPCVRHCGFCALDHSGIELPDKPPSLLLSSPATHSPPRVKVRLKPLSFKGKRISFHGRRFQHHFPRSRTPISPDTPHRRYPGKRYHLGSHGIPLGLEEHPKRKRMGYHLRIGRSRHLSFLHHKTCDPGIST